MEPDDARVACSCMEHNIHLAAGQAQSVFVEVKKVRLCNLKIVQLSSGSESLHINT